MRGGRGSAGPGPRFSGRIIRPGSAANRDARLPAPLPPLRKVGHRMAGPTSGRREIDADGGCHPVSLPHRRTWRTRTQRPLPRGRAALPQEMAVEGNVFTLRGCAACPRGRAGRDGSPPAAGQRCVTGRPGNPRGSGRCAPSARPCPPPSPRKTARHTAARPAPWPLRWPPAGGGIWRACPTWSPQA